MNKYIKFCSSIFLFLCIQGCRFDEQSNKSYSAETLAKINEVEHNLKGWVQLGNIPVKWTLEDRMKFYHANGVSIAVIKDYKIEWAKGYGWADSAEHTPVTTTTLFQAASISKSLNAMGIFKLVQDGKLDLYADINTQLKTWKFPYDSVSKGKKITLANLLTHTAGLNVHGFDGYEHGDKIPTLVQILNGEKPANNIAIRSVYEPSLKWEYSGGGFAISQLIVQDETGQPYDEYMWENVLKPLGMTNSSFSQPPSKEKLDLLATGYDDIGIAIDGKDLIFPVMAAQGLRTNPSDLAKYVIETQMAFQGKSQKVLNKEMTTLRLTPYKPAIFHSHTFMPLFEQGVDSSSAFGFRILNYNGIKYFNHGGGQDGFVCRFVGSFEKGNGVVVMTNSQNSFLLDEIINSVAQTYNWENYYTPIIKTEITLSDSTLETHVGTYTIENRTFLIFRKSDGLYLDTERYTPWKIHFTDGTHFFVFENDFDLNFESDKENKIIGFTINGAMAKKRE